MNKTNLLEEHLTESAHYLKSKLSNYPIPEVAVILGSGLKDFSTCLQDKVTIALNEVPNTRMPRVTGHGSSLEVGYIDGKCVALLTGRIHLYEGHSASDVVYNVRMLGVLGVKNIILTNAAGGLTTKLSPGQVVLIKDQINLTGQNCLTSEASGLGAQFIDMCDCYSKKWRESVQPKLNLSECVYAGLVGAAYETPSETSMLGKLGADVVGMSTVHEAIAARQLNMNVFGISLVTNLAGGLSFSLSHQEVIQTGKESYSTVEKALRTVIANLPN